MGVVNFEPLKPLFLQAYQHSHVYVPANASLPSLRLNVRRNPEIAELRDALPAVPLNYNELKATEVADANKYFARGKFVEALATFKSVLSKLLLVVVESEEDAEEVRFAISDVPYTQCTNTMDDRSRNLSPLVENTSLVLLWKLNDDVLLCKIPKTSFETLSSPLTLLTANLLLNIPNWHCEVR